MAEFKTCVQNGMAPIDVLDKVGLQRYCCRRFPITAVRTPKVLQAAPQDVTEDIRTAPQDLAKDVVMQNSQRIETGTDSTDG